MLHFKAVLYQFLCFAVIFLGCRWLLVSYAGIGTIAVLALSFIAATLFSPFFKVERTRDGDKLYMKWIFVKGVRQIR
jgi:hypothetical protein